MEITARGEVGKYWRGLAIAGRGQGNNGGTFDGMGAEDTRMLKDLQAFLLPFVPMMLEQKGDLRM